MKFIVFFLWSYWAVVAALSRGLDRRTLVKGAGVAAVSTIWRPVSSIAAEEDASLIVPKNKPVLVLGANGGTGRQCVAALLKDGRPCIAASRSGNFVEETTSVKSVSADVTSLDSLSEVITKDLGAVIFAASASAKGGNAAAVDRDGVLNAAKACIAANVPRLVVVSSGAVTRPDSAVYQLLNIVGKGIMEAKIQGEDGLRELYASPPVLERKLGYTVIRPGGLTNGEGVEVSALELNQGDSKSGRLARADVAALCVQALSSSYAFDTTFECYETVTAKPLESVSLSNILKSTDPTTFTSGKEQRGTDWKELFSGLERDPGHAV